jgi:hypothetical protein
MTAELFIECIEKFRQDVQNFIPKHEKSGERSETFRAKGNDLFAAKKYHEAIVLYNIVSISKVHGYKITVIFFYYRPS